MIVACSGCGTEGDHANLPRPATPINISAAITEDRLSISPKRFGAGPAVVIIVNEASDARRVTIESDTSSSPGTIQSTPPISPRGTATLKVDLKPGRYIVSTDGDRADDTGLRVGRARPSSSDQLLTP